MNNIVLCRLCCLVILMTGLNLHPLIAMNNEQLFDSIIRRLEKTCFSEGTQSRQLVRDLYNISAKDKENKKMELYGLHWEVKVNYFQGVTDTALMSKMHDLAKRLNADTLSYENALLNYTFSLYYTTIGNYADAFSKGLYSYEQFKVLNDSAFIAKSLNLLGSICFKIKSYKMAKSYYSQMFKYANKQQREYYSAYIHIYDMDKEKDHIIDSLKHFIPTLEQFNDPGLLVITYFNLSSLFLGKGDLIQASLYRNAGLNSFAAVDNNSIRFALYNQLGKEQVTSDNLPRAIQYFNKAKNTALQNGNSEQLYYISYQLSEAYEKMNNLDSAYYYIKEHNHLSNMLLNNSKTIETYQAYVSVILESAGKELTIAKQKIQLKNRLLTITIISVIGIIGIIIFIIIFFRQKKRQLELLRTAETRELAEHLAFEKKTRQMQKEKLESKIREITSYSLLLSNKNDLLQQISVLVHQLSQADKKERSTINKNIMKIIGSNLNTENERNNFMYHFDKVHPRFFDKLKSSCSSLTENNLRMCGYFRIGMSAKQVAHILNVSVETIKNGRYRLKKKLGLPEDQDLDDYLRNI